MPADFKVAGTSVTVAYAAAAGVSVCAAFAAPWSLRTGLCALERGGCPVNKEELRATVAQTVDVAPLDPSCVVHTVQVPCAATAWEHMQSRLFAAGNGLQKLCLPSQNDNDFDT